jgi:hypothetical protein
MKLSIQWHEQCLENMRLSLDRTRGELTRVQDRVAYEEQRVAFAERQLDEAKRRGLTEFDPERFLKQRGA